MKNNNLCCKVSGDHYTFESSDSCNIKCDVGYSSNGSGGATSGAISKCQKDYFMVELAGYLCDTRIKVEQNRVSVNVSSNGIMYCYPPTLKGGSFFGLTSVTNGYSNKKIISWTYNDKTYSKEILFIDPCHYCQRIETEHNNSTSLWASNTLYGTSQCGIDKQSNNKFVICNDKLLEFDKNAKFIKEY
ncbi:hypothetical protein HDR60_03840 [bacterium]|nr:hypothetical protein [bacterium]